MENINRLHNSGPTPIRLYVAFVAVTVYEASETRLFDQTVVGDFQKKG